ncbi:DNA-directed RNA polymerase subunit M/transcription elongation factor TFIIS [Aquibacillus albus]|uniref:DNA-directed RNA polymerase subunit M/transcription elongation factor TFIIS n=1 Tax=Aquibacillus albus TaxID=1168171 RepID=A0ABS2N571_9BACI|nr:DNA-directed RNA polymerase subunit M/transcription elongation factor TFIIS [Aquibacillus albus]
MGLINWLFTEKCPECNEHLTTVKSETIVALVIKSCPVCTYKKEFHPTLETYIESK